MREHPLTIPEIALVAGTRAALGAGLALLLADRLSPEARRAAGWALLAVGVLSTPLLLDHVLSRGEPEPAETEWVGV